MLMQWSCNDLLYNVIDCDVGKVSVVRYLGAWCDDQLTVAVHITNHLHNIRRMRKYSYPLFC